jgi:pimeloyl-ACP methyl ester carboxylesterase
MMFPILNRRALPIKGMILGAVLTSIASATLGADSSSHYVRQASNSNIAVIFVHGVLSEGLSAWTSRTGGYWPSMLMSDPAFDQADIFVYSYPTALWAKMSIDELAENMRLVLAGKGVAQHQKIIFLAHSMGGLVTRAYLLKNRDVANRTVFAYFFSTPTTGSQVASLATFLSGNPQFGKMMPMNADDYLADVQRQWLAAEFKFASYCAYEKQNTYGFAIVTMISASALCTRALDPIDADHINIVKPADKDSAPYLAFKVAYQREISTAPPAASEFKQISGIVTDESDAAIQGAKVVLTGSPDSMVTQKDGGFSLPVHGSEQWVHLSITKDGFHPLNDYYSVRRDVHVMLCKQ